MDKPTSESRRQLLLALGSGMLAASTPASADLLDRGSRGLLGGLVKVTVIGNRAVAAIQISVLGLGLVAIEAIFDFDNPQNLTPSSLGVSVGLTNPLALLGRIDLTRLSLALPISITVEPPAALGFSFDNAVAVELHTEALGFTLNSPLRLYKAPVGGTFFDITDDILSGSVRTRGRTGGFSEFLIVTDLLQLATPTLAYQTDAQAKYLFLATQLLAPSVSPKARTVLENDLAASRVQYDAGNYAAARAGIATFAARVKSFRPPDVPNRWRAARDLVNVAGNLLGEASSLDFILRRLGG